jgi:hypothetical protein
MGQHPQTEVGPDGLASVEARRIDHEWSHSMHTQGTAVLDRPAEATVPAEALWSAFDASTNTFDLELARSTDDAAKALAPRYGGVRDLTYGELAVALNVSGVRSRRFRSASPAQLMEWAAQGLALSGIDCIRHYDRRTRYLNGIPDHRMSADHWAEYAQMWPSFKARQRCHDAAWRLAFPHPASRANPYPHAAPSTLHG